MKARTFKSISASQGVTVDTLNTALSPWCRVHDKADPALHRSPRKLRRSFMTGRKGDKQRQGVSSRKPLLTLLLGDANIGQKREQVIANLSWSFKLEGDAEDRHKWSLNACKCCVSTKPSSCLIQQPSFESGLEKSKTGVKTKNQAKHTKNIKTLQVGIQLVEGAEARLTSEQMRLSPRVKWVKWNIAKQSAGEHWLLSTEALLKSKHSMACHQFPMVGYIHRMDTGNLPSCESCGKMLLTSKSGVPKRSSICIWPCFPEFQRGVGGLGLNVAECLGIVDLPRLQEVESDRCLGSVRPTRSCLAA